MGFEALQRSLISIVRLKQHYKLRSNEIFNYLGIFNKVEQFSVTHHIPTWEEFQIRSSWQHNKRLKCLETIHQSILNSRINQINPSIGSRNKFYNFIVSNQIHTISGANTNIHQFGQPRHQSNSTKQIIDCKAFTKRQMSGISDEETSLRRKFKPKEVKFKTPYGHIACLEWGKQEAPHKILCAHGWLDNAGSFERLVPFILDHNDNSEKYHIVSMDMPGVGHSSHKPLGADYTTYSNILEMRRVANQLDWKKMTLLSHSLGSHHSFMYACIYPDQVETVISVDLTHPITRQVHNWNITIANSIEEHFKCEYHSEDDPMTNIRVPVYSEVDAIKRLMDGHSNSLSRESAEVLLKRGARKQRWGYTFNRDVRLRYLSMELRPDDDLMLQFLEGPFRPNLFIIRANRSPYHRPEEIRMKYYELFKRNCPLFRDVLLEGTHHLHMNTPDTVAPEIVKFLDDVRSMAATKTGGDVVANGQQSITKSNL